MPTGLQPATGSNTQNLNIVEHTIGVIRSEPSRLRYAITEQNPNYMFNNTKKYCN